MKRQPLTLLCILALTALSGCISPDKAMKSYLGQPSTELVARWGPPQNKMSDGQGGEIWTYFEQRQWTTPGQANTTVTGTGNTYGNVYGNPYGATYQGNTSVYGSARTTYTPPQTHGYTAHRTFFINGNGIVYRYAWKGL
jgi:hypothetical protein